MTVQCPYCISDINGAAIVCPHCQRDLYLFRPLLDKIAKLEALQDRVAALEKIAQTATLAETPAEPAAAAGKTRGATKRVRQPTKQTPQLLLLDLLRFVLLPVLLLMAGHGLMVMLYDLKPVYLRVFSLILPLPFGVAFASMSLTLGNARHGWAVVIGLVCAVLSVLGMSFTTHMVDHSPLLPTNARDAREFFEYTLSIALSFATGVLVQGLWQRQAWQDIRPPGITSRLAKWMSDGHSAIESVESLSSKISTIAGTAATVGAGVTATYTGLRSVMGH